MIIINNIKSLIKNDRLYCVLLILLFSVSALSILFLFEFYASVDNYSRSNHIQSRTYYFDVDYKNIDNNMDKFYSSNKSKIQNLYAIISDKKEKVYAKYDISVKNSISVGNAYSSNTAKEMLIYSDFNKKIFIGDYYELFGEKYKIVGQDYRNENLEIPYFSLDSKEKAEKVSFVLKYNLSEKEIDSVINSAKNIFSIKKIEYPPKANVNLSSFIDDLLLAGAIMLLCLFNMSFVFLGILKRRRKQTAILHLLGYSKARIAFYYITEIILITIPVYLVCCLLADFGIFPLLSNTSNGYFIKIGIQNYLTAFIGIMIVMILILSFQFYKQIKKTPIEMKRAI